MHACVMKIRDIAIVLFCLQENVLDFIQLILLNLPKICPLHVKTDQELLAIKINPITKNGSTITLSL
jgi:hypothetical protein